MVDLRRYAKRLQDAFGKEYSPGKNSADSIDEDHWLNVVVDELNIMSFECAKELEPEIGRLQEGLMELLSLACITKRHEQ